MGGENISLKRQREELSEPGVYLLLGDGADDSSAIEMYIGETDNFSDRLTSHAQGKDFWSQFVVFVSKDKNLTKAHVKYLEREIYLLAEKAIGTLTVKNITAPSGSSLPESDIAAMNEFMDNIVFVLETLGLSYFPSNLETISIANINPERKRIDPAISEGTEFYINLPKDLVPEGKPQPKAYMYIKNNAYFLKEGSLIKSIARQSFDGHAYYNIWEQIVKSDAVRPTELDGLLETTRDIEFRSPSAAGAIARAGQTNGRTDWKRSSDDMPLNLVEASEGHS